MIFFHSILKLCKCLLEVIGNGNIGNLGFNESDFFYGTRPKYVHRCIKMVQHILMKICGKLPTDDLRKIFGIQ